VTRTATANKKDKAMDDDDDIKSGSEQTEEKVAVDATRNARTARIEDAKARAEAETRAADDAVAKERSRISSIQDLAERSGLGDTWSANLIKAGVSVEKAREAAFTYITQKDAVEFNTDGTVRIEAGDDERDKFIRGASAWLFRATGQSDMLAEAKKRAPDKFKDVDVDPGDFSGYTPFELARHCLERDKVSTRGMDRMTLVGRAFVHRASSYQTAGDFPSILENVFGKVLLGAYLLQDNTYSRFCRMTDVVDFRASNRYRTGSLPGLDVIAEHGEYKTGAIPDASKYPVLTKRLGKMFALSRETIINDDMGALADMAVQLGRAAQRTIENAVYALLAQNAGLGPTMPDTLTFFHANRGNIGVGSAISVAGLDADRVLMRAQKDPNGLDFIDLNPSVLVVPDALRGTAQVINDAQYDPDTVNKLQRPNMVRGLFKDIVGTPRLAASSTRRYLIADPNEAAAIEVAYLAGYGRAPAIESQDGWRIDGVEWKVTLYANPQAADPKAAVTNAGV
jgi:hypothetical protein